MNVILVHGYGVRGFFWDLLGSALAGYGIAARAPDFGHQTVDDWLKDLSQQATALAEETGQPVTLVGHSLGGIMSALVARDLPVETIERVVVISSPFGANRTGISVRLIRWAINRGLLPARAIRPRFFGPHIPAHTQAELFGKAVKESESLRELPWQAVWFHTNQFAQPLSQRCDCWASPDDRVVSAEQTRAFARAIGAAYHPLRGAAPVGHDDIAVDPALAKTMAAWLADSGGRTPTDTQTQA